VAYLVAEQGWLGGASGGVSGVAWLFLITSVMFLLPLAWGKVRIAILTVPVAAPILVHLLRVLQEVSLWQFAVAKDIPAEITLLGANLDVHIGATAMFVSVALYSGSKFGRPAAIVWNILGLTILAATVSNGLSYANQAGATNVLAAFPTVWLPAFMWPFWLFTHLVSLWQLLAPANLKATADALKPKPVKLSKPSTAKR